MLRTLLCKASKPLKLVALSDLTNVLISWISLQYVLEIVLDFPDGAFSDFILLPQCPLTRHVRFAQLCDDFTSLASVKHVASGFIYFPLRIIESKGLENNISKVRTYQISAHQRLRFKVCT